MDHVSLNGLPLPPEDPFPLQPVAGSGLTLTDVAASFNYGMARLRETGSWNIRPRHTTMTEWWHEQHMGDKLSIVMARPIPMRKPFWVAVNEMVEEKQRTDWLARRDAADDFNHHR